MTLTATVDASTASVKLLVDFSSVVPDASYNRVTVTRADGTIVRGLDNALAPGGMTRGIDHEATLGVMQMYTATVTNGTATLSPSTVTATLPVQTVKVRIKSLRTPALSVQVLPQSYPEWAPSIPKSVLPIFGSKFPNASDGTRQGGTGSLTVLTTTLDELGGLRALLDSPGPYLIQFTAQSGEPDVYVSVGDVTVKRPVNFSGDTYRVVTLPLTVVGRPSTGGSTVSIPYATFQDSLANRPLFSDRTGTFVVDYAPPGEEPEVVSVGYDGGWV